MNIWARIIIDDKVVKDCVHSFAGNLDEDKLNETAREICYKLDVPTPIVIDVTLHYLLEFHYVKFIESDFVESINFDRMEFELF